MLDEFAGNAEVNNAILKAIAAIGLDGAKSGDSEFMEVVVPKLLGPLPTGDVSQTFRAFLDIYIWS